MDTISDRIQTLIASLGIRKVDFATNLNITQAFVSQICSGARNPSDRTISDICRIYGVREHWLRTGEGDMMEPLERDQEIARILGRILSADSPSVKRRFINVLCKASEEELEAIERFAVRLAEEYKKETGGE